MKMDFFVLNIDFSLIRNQGENKIPLFFKENIILSSDLKKWGIFVRVRIPLGGEKTKTKKRDFPPIPL